MEVQTTFKKRIPANLWKQDKKIIIKFNKAGVQEFRCIKLTNKNGIKEKYFYSREANHSYHSRLFNRPMLVGYETLIFNVEEMQRKALTRAIKAKKQMDKALGVLKQTVKEEGDIDDIKHKRLPNMGDR